MTLAGKHGARSAHATTIRRLGRCYYQLGFEYLLAHLWRLRSTLIHESKWLAAGATAYQAPALLCIKLVRFDISGDNIVELRSYCNTQSFPGHQGARAPVCDRATDGVHHSIVVSGIMME